MYGSSFNPRMGRPGGAMGMGRMGPMARMDVARGGMDMGFGAPMEMSRGSMDMGRGGMGPGMGAGPVEDVGNVTNDPTTIHCRVFVGNLNTHLMTKEDVERIFCNYGMITGISMHKGYAFVQYTNPRDARRAATLEDGKFYANMRLDCNVASEPKNSNRGQKRAGTVSALNRQTSGGGNQSWAGAGPPNKKVRTDVNPSMKRTLVTISSGSATPGTTAAKSMVKKAVATSLAKPKVTGMAAKQATTTSALNTSSGDILICGRCRAMFPNVHRLAMHKKVQCVVKTNCKCQTQNIQDLEPTPLTCAKCTLSFTSAWDLLQHCQAEHSMAIFKAVGQVNKPSPDKPIKPEPKSGGDGVNGDEIDEALEESLLSENPVEGGTGDN